MILLDTSGLLAAIDASQTHHSQAAKALLAAEPPLLLSPFILAELDYLLAARVGIEAELALLREVAADVYRLESFDAADIATARDYVRQYSDVDLGLADASIIVLANRYDVSDVLTLDERHFGTVRRDRRRRFRLLPGDV